MSTQTETGPAPYLYLIGLTTAAGCSDAELAEFHTYYDTVHVPHVTAANRGFGSPERFELDGEPDEATPRWLTLYPVDSRESAEAYLARQGEVLDRRDFAPGPPAWDSAVIAWRAMWRLVSGQHSPGPTRNLLIAGIEPPADLDTAELAEFDEFYDHGHIPEIQRYGGYSGCRRYELVAALPGGHGDHPRYCTLYTADDLAADFDPKATLATAGRSGLLSAGPEVWQRRSNPWRAWWRPLG